MAQNERNIRPQNMNHIGNRDISSQALGRVLPWSMPLLAGEPGDDHMSEHTEERAGEREAHESESFKSTILPVLLGLIVNLIVDTFSGLTTPSKMIVIIGLSVVYSGGEIIGKRPKRFEISSRAKKLMTIAFIIAVLLILAAALILGLSLEATVFLVGWTILMALALQFASSIPEGNVVAKVAMTRIAAFTLGAALAIGGAPVVDVALGGPAYLTVVNGCDHDFRYSAPGIDIDVPHGGSQTLEMPRVAIDVERHGNQITVGGPYGQLADFEVPKGIKIAIDDQPLEPGYSRRVDLGDSENHTLTISCG